MRSMVVSKQPGRSLPEVKYCILRQKRRGLTKADDKEVEFRKQVVLMVTRVNTARTLKGKKWHT